MPDISHEAALHSARKVFAHVKNKETAAHTAVSVDTTVSGLSCGRGLDEVSESGDP